MRQNQRRRQRQDLCRARESAAARAHHHQRDQAGAQRRYDTRTNLSLHFCKTEGLFPPPLPHRKPRDLPLPSPKWRFGCPPPTRTHRAPWRERYHVPEHHSTPVIFHLCCPPLAQSHSTSGLSFGKLKKHHLRRQKGNTAGWQSKIWPTNTKGTPQRSRTRRPPVSGISTVSFSTPTCCRRGGLSRPGMNPLLAQTPVDGI